MNNIVKNSGIDWIGSIPSNWKCERIKNILCERNENNKPIKTKDILSLTNDRGVIPYSEKGAIGNNSKDDLTGYKLAYPNDIVLNSMNVIIGSVGLSKYFGCVSPVYYMLYLRNKNDSIEYFNYLFQTKELQNRLKGYGNGIMEIRMRIQMSKLNTVMLPYPSSKVQFAIVNKIKESEANINSLILNQEKQIGKLIEYRKSLINKAVTKGLNLNCKYKSVDNRFIQSIPNNWDFKQLKYIATSIQKGNGITKEDLDPNGDSYCVRYGEIYTKYQTSFDKCYSKTNSNKLSSLQYFSYGDVLCAGTGELVDEIGKSIVYLGKQKALTGGDIVLIKHNQSPLFMGYALDSIYSQQQKSFGKAKLKVVHISASDLGNIYIALPPIEEQKEIESFLKEKDSKIQSLINDKVKKIDLLNDYKKTLIYEYVTGKKEVI